MPFNRLVLILLIACALSVSAHAQTAELREMATYTSSTSTLTQGFTQIINRTIEWDELAYGLVEKKIQPPFAKNRSKRLSVELRARYKELNDKLEKLSDSPKISIGPNTNQRIKNNLSAARLVRDMAYDSIVDGEKLVVAALNEDPDVFEQIQHLSIKRLFVHLKGQQSLLEDHIKIERKNSFTFYLANSYKTTTDILVLFLSSVLENPDHSLADISLMIDEAKTLHQQGKKYIEQGRKTARQQQDIYTLLPQKKEEMKKLKEVLIGILSQNAPASFNVEEKILDELLLFFADVSDPDNENKIDDILTDYINKITLLENERQRLAIDRQTKIANMK